MEHWAAVFLDIWGVLRWVLPPLLFMLTGLASAAASAGDKDADVLCFVVGCIGGAVYVAAMMGWGVR